MMRVGRRLIVVKWIWVVIDEYRAAIAICSLATHDGSVRQDRRWCEAGGEPSPLEAGGIEEVADILTGHLYPRAGLFGAVIKRSRWISDHRAINDPGGSVRRVYVCRNGAGGLPRRQIDGTRH